VRFALAQVNSTVGALSENAAKIVRYIAEATEAGADLIVFPELAISGYPPEDLLLKEHFLMECRDKLREVAAACVGVTALVGVPLWEGGAVYNAIAVLAHGSEAGFYRKICLPNYAVFDEKRYFKAGDKLAVLRLRDLRIGVNVCEDIWVEQGPTEAVAQVGGAQVVVNMSMSPYHLGRGLEREDMLSRRAKGAGAYICYVNGTGGQDELIFDGQSVVFDPQGRLIARAPQFVEDLMLVDIEPETRSVLSGGAGDLVLRPLDVITVESLDRAPHRPAAEPEKATSISTALSVEAEIYAALCMGVRDYVDKNRFKHVVIGMSGGIDSALTACVAVDALGAERVTGVSMPSRYSSAGTQSDARETCQRLGMEFREIPIENVFRCYLETLAPSFEGQATATDVTEQNIQARIRGNYLMALSNKFGWLVLTTGNKSEMAVGYATLYGDMAGGFAVLKDVYKTTVYRLSRYRNSLAGRSADAGLRDTRPHHRAVRGPGRERGEHRRPRDRPP
jgi:NAD+ synthase (glutamine-hydrolysing)